MWIETHDTLLDHRKVRRLSRDISVTSSDVRGHLVTLWLRVVRLEVDGDLEGWDADDIEDAAEWTGERGQFFAALLDVGFLDETEAGGYVVHNWMKYAGSYRKAQEREKDRDRKRVERARLKAMSSDCPGVSLDKSVTSENVTICPPRTEQNGTERNGTEKPAPRSKKTSSPATLIPEEIFILFPCADGDAPISEQEVDRWAGLYGLVDVRQELRHMVAYWEAKPKGHRKTCGGCRRSITAWLKKEQDRGHPRPTAAKRTVHDYTDDEYTASILSAAERLGGNE